MKRKNLKETVNLAILLPFLGLFFFAGCDKPNLTLTSALVNNGNTNIVLVDSFAVNLSTVALDSFQTSGSGTLLIGSYNDPYFGNITSKAFLQLRVPGSVPSISDFAVFDSINLIMRINKSFYGDTTIPQTYYVSQLDSNYILPIPPKPRAFFNTTNLAYNPVPLGSNPIPFTIKPNRFITRDISTKDTVAIRLPDSLGKNLMHLMYVKSDIVTNNTSFLNYFNGLCIYSDNNSKGVIFGFKDSAFVRLVYHEPGGNFHYVTVDFPLDNGTTQFNQVTVDRSAAPLSILPALQNARPNPNIPTEIPSNLTQGTAYVQSMTGLQAKVTFPSVFNLTLFPDYIGLLRAELVVKPQPGTYSPLFPLPTQLTPYQTNSNDQLGNPLTSGNSIEYGGLVNDYITGNNTQYSYDVTNYIKSLLTQSITQNGLMLNIPSPGTMTTFNRIAVADRTNKSYSIKLLLYYISLPH